MAVNFGRPAGSYGAGPPWPQYGQSAARQQQQTQAQSMQYNYAQVQAQVQPGQQQYAQQQATYYPQQQVGQYTYSQQQPVSHQYGQQAVSGQYTTQQPPNPAQYGQYPTHGQYATQQNPAVAHWEQQQGMQQSNAYSGPVTQAYPAQGYQQQSFYQQPIQQSPYSQSQSQNPPNPANNNSNGCYNCGNPGHWAQSCPEPRRMNPAGASSQPGGHIHPNKRQRPNYIPPVVTKYQVPNHVQHAHFAQLSSAAPFQPSPGGILPGDPNPHSQSQVAYGQAYANGIAPPTPVSANSPGYPQSQPWKAPMPSPAISHTQSHTGTMPYTPQASPPNPSSGYAVPPPPAAVPPPLPPESPASYVDKPGGFNKYAQKSQETLRKRQTQKDRKETDATTIVPTLKTGVTGSFEDMALQNKTASGGSNTSVPDTSKSAPEHDLNLLDIPDLPTEDPAKYRHTATHLISAPLQTFSATDVPNLIPEPAKGSAGTIVSKYVRPATLATNLENVRKTEYFERLRDDPIFRFQVPAQPPPPVVPAAPPVRGYSLGDDRQKLYHSETLYKTVSNGPAEAVPRASTPVPQADPDAQGGDEYDPFDPAAGFPEEYTQVLPADDNPWSVHADAGPSWGGERGSEIRRGDVERSGSNGSHDVQPIKRKRSDADGFQNSCGAPLRKQNSGRKKRMSQANGDGRRW